MQKNNVLTLERAILDGSARDVSDVLKNLGPFEFTARALAISARFGSAEKTDVLLKNGATLDYNRNSNLLRLEYNTIYSTSEIWGSDYPAKYTLFPVFDRVTERLMFFGTLYEPHDGVHLLLDGSGTERAPAPESARAGSVGSMCRHNAMSPAEREEMLYYALMFGCSEITEVLRNCGTELDSSRDVSGGYIRLISSFDDIEVAVRGLLKYEVERNRANFEVNDGMITYLLRYESWLTTRWDEFLTLLMCGDPSGSSLRATALRLVELDADDRLADLYSCGLPEFGGIDQLLDRAIDGGRNRALAFLLNVKHNSQ